MFVQTFALVYGEQKTFHNIIIANQKFDSSMPKEEQNNDEDNESCETICDRSYSDTRRSLDKQEVSFEGSEENSTISAPLSEHTNFKNHPPRIESLANVSLIERYFCYIS